MKNLTPKKKKNFPIFITFSGFLSGINSLILTKG